MRPKCLPVNCFGGPVAHDPRRGGGGMPQLAAHTHKKAAPTQKTTRKITEGKRRGKQGKKRARAHAHTHWRMTHNAEKNRKNRQGIEKRKKRERHYCTSTHSGRTPPWRDGGCCCCCCTFCFPPSLPTTLFPQVFLSSRRYRATPWSTPWKMSCERGGTKTRMDTLYDGRHAIIAHPGQHI